MTDILPTQGTFKIYTLGMSERGRQTMRMFFDRHLANRCQIAAAADAHAVIIDADGYHAEELLHKHLEEFPKHHVILLTMTPEKHTLKNGVIVRKPIDVSAFSAALRELMGKFFTPPAPAEAKPAAAPARFTVANESVLKEKLARASAAEDSVTDPGIVASSNAPSTSADSTDKDAGPASATKTIVAPPSLIGGELDFYIGSSPDVDLDDPVAREGIFYRPENFLQGHIQRVLSLATERSVAMRMSGAGFQTIVVDPLTQRILSAVPLSALLAAGRIPLAYKDLRVDPISTEDVNALSDTAESFGTESLLWRLALRASRGRLPADASLDAPVLLMHWPNLTRLQLPPHAARILGLWSRYQTPLGQTPASLDIPQRYVFSLYSACQSIGLMKPQDKQAKPPAPVEAPVKAHQKQGLFRMLLSKLSGYSDLVKTTS